MTAAERQPRDQGSAKVEEAVYLPAGDASCAPPPPLVTTCPNGFPGDPGDCCPCCCDCSEQDCELYDEEARQWST